MMLAAAAKANAPKVPGVRCAIVSFKKNEENNEKMHSCAFLVKQFARFSIIWHQEIMTNP